MQMITQTRVPFSNTKADPEQTKLEITKILANYGIKDHQWTVYHGQVELKFATEIMWNDKTVELQCILRPPELKEYRRVYDEKAGRQVKKWVGNLPASYRLMKDHLRNRLALVSCGAFAFEEIFLNDLRIEDPLTKESMRYADFLRRHGQIPGLALPDKSEDQQSELPAETHVS